MKRLLNAYLATAGAGLLIGTIGLATAPNFDLVTLNRIFFFMFFPSIAIGLVTYAKGKEA